LGIEEGGTAWFTRVTGSDLGALCQFKEVFFFEKKNQKTFAPWFSWRFSISPALARE
jgi:hypothetical protein